MSHTTAGERLVGAIHSLELCDANTCDHYEDGELSSVGHAVAQSLLNAFYDYSGETE